MIFYHEVVIGEAGDSRHGDIAGKFANIKGFIPIYPAPLYAFIVCRAKTDQPVLIRRIGSHAVYDFSGQYVRRLIGGREYQNFQILRAAHLGNQDMIRQMRGLAGTGRAENKFDIFAQVLLQIVAVVQRQMEKLLFQGFQQESGISGGNTGFPNFRQVHAVNLRAAFQFYPYGIGMDANRLNCCLVRLNFHIQNKGNIGQFFHILGNIAVWIA